MKEPAGTTIAVLGPFAATSETGLKIALPKKAQALLGYLACTSEHRARREDLAALLWNDRSRVEARHSLRQCLAVVRKSLGDAARQVVTEADAVVIPPGDSLRIDMGKLAPLESASSVVELRAADTLFRGELLEGLSTRSDPFDSWLHVERQALQERRITLLKRLCELQRASGDAVAAIETARKLSALDPYREEWHRLLLELLAASGQRGLAVVEHARVERLLRDDLGLAPDQQTRRLAADIRSGRRTETGADTAPGSHSSAADTFPTFANPVVTLLPFECSSQAPELHAFAKALPEDLATLLYRQRWRIAVVMATRGGLDRCGHANYNLGGMVRHEGDRLRISMLLSQAATGIVAWAHTQEASANALLSSDTIVSQLTGKLGAAVQALEARRVEAHPGYAENGKALLTRAAAMSRKNRAGNVHALALLRRVSEVEPSASVYALAARCLHVQRLMGWVHPRDPSLKEAERFAFQALELDGDDPEVLWLAGLALANVDGNAAEGRALLKKSLNINPSNASAWIASAFVHSHSGDPAVGLYHFERAQLANAEDSSQHVQWHAAAMAHFIAGNYEQADQATDRALLEAPSYPGSLRMKIATSALLGRLEDAQSHAKRLLRVNPDASLGSMQDYWRPWTRYTAHALAALLTAWRRVGLPD